MADNLAVAGAQELDLNGVLVLRAACNRQQSTKCLVDTLSNLETYLALPGSMNSSSVKRHFLRFSVASDFTVTRAAHHRCNFILPISPSIDELLRATFAGTTGAIVLKALGPGAIISEITAIASQTGSAEQTVHSDGNWDASVPRVLTMFVALHDIADESMGPTRFYPKTHNPSCFADNMWRSPSDRATTQRESVWFKLRAGDAVLMDSTTWHYGSANVSGQTRTLLSVSFTCPSTSSAAAAASNVEGTALESPLRLVDFMR